MGGPRASAVRIDLKMAQILFRSRIKIKLSRTPNVLFAHPMAEKKKILVVEDDPDCLFLMEKILENAGYNVESSQDGSHLMDTKKFVCPDLFILDNNAGLIDGLTICRYLKAQKACATIPIIMITGSAEMERIAIQEGVDHFLSKPINTNHLLEIAHALTTKSK